MASLEAEVDAVAEATAFSGVVRVDRAEGLALAKAYGAADRANAIANTVDTRFGIASGSKGMTALAVMSLVQDGTLTLRTTARSVLGADLPLIADDVTVEHLLAHRSGIGDYLDEEADVEVTDYLMTVPVQHLARTEDFLAVLDGFPTVSPAGERFAYNNGGYVVLALIAERASGVPFHDLVRDRVCVPAGMTTAAYLRSDELPGGVALGYLTVDQPRTNIFHLPVRGNGDGGMYATVADFAAFWSALFAGAIVPRERVAEMVRPRSVEEDGSRRYGIGFWLHANTDVVWLEGHDAGVSFCSVHDPVATITHTVISNTSEGAWPVSIRLDQILGT
jgi:CubicO group peptidase (beta-lactamase class C family)